MLLAQAKQREEAELQQRAERIRRLEARRKQQEEAAAKTLWQQLQAHQVGAVTIDVFLYWHQQFCPGFRVCSEGVAVTRYKYHV